MSKKRALQLKKTKKRAPFWQKSIGFQTLNTSLRWNRKAFFTPYSFQLGHEQKDLHVLLLFYGWPWRNHSCHKCALENSKKHTTEEDNLWDCRENSTKTTLWGTSLNEVRHRGTHPRAIQIEFQHLFWLLHTTSSKPQPTGGMVSGVGN